MTFAESTELVQKGGETCMARRSTVQRGDGSRAPVTGSDTVGEKLQPSDLRHTTHREDGKGGARRKWRDTVRRY